jgi:ubiquinone/menaquinone biosynthesis C-methylase UbiE
MPNLRLLLKLAIIAATSRSTQVFYDQISPFYDSIFTDHLIHVQTMATVLREEIPAGCATEVLDIACGTGALSCCLEERGFCVTGLDFSFESLRRLKRINRRVRLVQADAAALPFRSDSFDVVTCMGAWRHFSDPERVLQEICRVLRPEGVFFVGYFPPKLGGLFRVPSGMLGKTMVTVYGSFIRLLSYNDRTDQETERQTLRMIEKAFAQCSLVPSGNREYLILAASPR